MNTLELICNEMKKYKIIPYVFIVYNTRNAIKITLMNIYNDTFKTTIYNSDNVDITLEKITKLISEYNGGEW